jgi:hypothetical protein
MPKIFCMVQAVSHEEHGWRLEPNESRLDLQVGCDALVK